MRPGDIALLFGSERGNRAQLKQRTEQVAAASQSIARLIDGLSPREFDRRAFRPRPGMSPAKRRQLAQLELRYQSARNGLEITQSRLRLVRAAARTADVTGRTTEVNVDLLLHQMFGALDRIRLHMSLDLMQLETFLARYERSARTQEILRSFQQLVELQGGIGGPNPGLANVLDWLEESSIRKLAIEGDALRGGLGEAFPESSDLLREAHERGSTAPARERGKE